MLKSSPDLLAKIGFTLQKQDETGSVILDLLATRPDCRENMVFSISIKFKSQRTKIHRVCVWLLVSTPLKNDGVRQLG